MDENEELYRGLVLLLKMFKNRPYHLAKYMVDNSALNNEFIKKLLKSDKLKELSEEESDKPITQIYFTDISKMDDFYNTYIDDIKQISKEKGLAELTKELNEKLDNCIRNEKYEDASRIRDYMNRNGIKRISIF